MQQIQHLCKKIIPALLLTVVLLLTMLPSQVIAQSNSTSRFSNLINRVQSLFVRPRRIGAPTGRRTGGAGRGERCRVDVETLPPLTALVPTRQGSVEEGATVDSTAIAIEYSWGKTVDSYPTFWFYVPYSASSNLRAEFMLLDDAKHPIPRYPVTISLESTPGIIHFQVPYELENEGEYNWYFSILCDPERPSRNPGVRGWIQQEEIAPVLAATLEETEPRQRYLTYLENEIWFEAVTTLVQAYSAQPQDFTLQQDWITLLNSYELREAPSIVDCCK